MSSAFAFIDDMELSMEHRLACQLTETDSACTPWSIVQLQRQRLPSGYKEIIVESATGRYLWEAM